MYREKTVYIVFGTIWGFRHPLGSWNVLPVDKRELYCIAIKE